MRKNFERLPLWKDAVSKIKQNHANEHTQQSEQLMQSKLQLNHDIVSHVVMGRCPSWRARNPNICLGLPMLTTLVTGDHTKPFIGQRDDEMLNLSPGWRYPWPLDNKTIEWQASGDSTSVAKLMECKKFFTNIFASWAAMVEPRQHN